MSESSSQLPDESAEGDLRLPAGLQRDLRALYQPPVSVPANIEADILGRAQRQLIHRRTGRSSWLIGAAVAAAALIAGSLYVFTQSRNPGGSPGGPVATGGQNPSAGGTSAGNPMAAREHEADIMDAFALARQLRAGAATPDEDVNHDGKVDQADVDFLAQQAVSLTRGTL